MNKTIPNASSLYTGEVTKSKMLDNAYEVTDFFPDMGEKGKWFRITASSIRDSRGNLFGSIEMLEDITEQKVAEEELLKRTKLESLGNICRRCSQGF